MLNSVWNVIVVEDYHEIGLWFLNDGWHCEELDVEKLGFEQDRHYYGLIWTIKRPSDFEIKSALRKRLHELD